MVSSASNKTITAVRKDIEAARAKRSNLMDASQFEKDKTPRYVLRMNLLHIIAKTHFRTIRGCDKSEILNACDKLLSLRKSETSVVALDWAILVRRSFDRKDLPIFERWLKEYVHGWGMCDGLCCGPLGLLICDYPDLTGRTGRWAKSKNLWLRRAAAVSLIPSVRQGQSFDQAVEIADTLLVDSEDYVQKGYGWLLKEASKRFQSEVLAFVIERKDRMPRTALRYAIEKMPQAMRHRAMRRD